MGFIIPLILTIVVIWIYQGTKGVNYLFSLKRKLIDEYGWTKSEFDIIPLNNDMKSGYIQSSKCFNKNSLGFSSFSALLISRKTSLISIFLNSNI